ncbi:hypothetical protein BST91_12710 [Nonlabens tegetincola]|uniref:DUF4271 domain-containing protein n=1 Tax=Nonlabens tegetincola TaxID=323273 RepID=UPI000A208594|nr:DUF4271 domain-containing protein [Nonlabens tegetincola]ARN72462.1 hypothetical protein BST91_12710 [Nonlabens tegetincola]
MSPLAQNFDWFFIVLTTLLVFVVIARYMSSIQITDYLSVFINDKIIKVTLDEPKTYRWIHAALIICYFVALTTIAQLVWGDNHLISKEWVMKLLLIILFYSFQYFVSKICSVITKTEDVVYLGWHYRWFMRNGFAIVAILFAIVAAFKSLQHDTLVIAGITAVFIEILISILIIVKLKKVLLNNWFYFILYLCALEIAPYLLLYKYVKGG